MSLIRRVARPMLATIFVVGGLDALRHPGARAKIAEPVVSRLAAPLGLPQDPELLVRANGAAMMAAGSLLALGRFPRLASAALATSMVPTTLVGHPFWSDTDPVKRGQNRLHFLKNVGLLGGLLLAAVDTDGKPGIAYRARLAGRAADRAAGNVRRDARYAAKAARREARLKVAQAHNALS